MLVPVRNLGGAGVVRDQAPHDLPPNVITNSRNVLFQDGAARKKDGLALIAYDITDKYSAWFETWQYQAGTYKQAVARSDGVITVWNGAAFSTPILEDQAGATKVLAASDEWQSTVFGKFCLLNNRIDMPMYSWNAGTSSADGSKFRQIPGWGAATSPTGAVKAVRAHRNFLIAVGVAASPYTVYWSDAAAIDGFPQSWDYADPTNLAGYLQISAADGPLIDCAEMGDMMMVYTASAAYALQYVGGSDVFALRRLLPYGVINRECAVQFEGKHFCIGDNTVYVHDGINVERVADTKVERAFFSEISDAKGVKCTAIADRAEVWVYYSTDATKGANLALVWNWRSGAWAFIDMYRHACIAPSIVIEASPTIGSLGETIGSYSGSIGDWARSGVHRVLIASQGDGATVPFALYKVNSGLRVQDGVGSPTPFAAYIERIGLDLDEVKGNAMRSVHLRRVVPQVTGSGTVYCQIGSQRSPSDNVAWGDTVALDLDGGDEYKVDVRHTGRYLAYRFGQWDGAPQLNQWRLTGFDLDIMDGGR